MSEQQEVIYTEVTEGDYNDVYSRKYVKGTWDQIEQYVKSHFSEEGLKEAQEIGSSGGYGLETYYPVTDEEGNEVDYKDPRYGELADQEEVRVLYYVEAIPFYDATPKEIQEIESDSRFINLMEDD